MQAAHDNATLDPQMAADLARLEAAESTPAPRPQFWTCADPPWGCGQMKPSSEFSFEPRKGQPRGGGKDLCNDCKRTAPRRYRQRKTRQEIQDILLRMGRQGEAEAPPTLAKLAITGARAFGGIEELMAGIVMNVDALDEAGKHTSAGNMRLGMLKVIGKAAERLEDLKPVEQMGDDELLADKQHINQILVQNIHNYYVQQADMPELPEAAIPEPSPVIEHEPARSAE